MCLNSNCDFSGKMNSKPLLVYTPLQDPFVLRYVLSFVPSTVGLPIALVCHGFFNIAKDIWLQDSCFVTSLEALSGSYSLIKWVMQREGHDSPKIAKKMSIGAAKYGCLEGLMFMEAQLSFRDWSVSAISCCV